MTPKEEIIAMLEDLPENSTIEDIEYHLYVRRKIEAAKADVDQGRTISHEEMKDRVAAWRKG